MAGAVRTHSPWPSPPRTSVWAIVFFTVFSVGCLAGGCLLIGRMHAFRAWSGRLKSDIYLLAEKRPPEIPRGQWEFAVGWTVNLHANCTADFTQASPDNLKAFTLALEEKLEGPVD